jgi:hypothetical protein
LPFEAQQKVVNAIYINAFSGLARQWRTLDAQIKGLPSAKVGAAVDGTLSQRFESAVCILFQPGGDEYTKQPVPLWLVSNSAPSEQAAQATDEALRTTAKDPLIQADSVAEAARGLGLRLGTTVEAAPELRDRRLFMVAQPSASKKVLSALAELHGWRLISDGPDAKPVYRLHRRHVTKPKQPTDLGQIMRNALPLDLARALTSCPKRLNGNPVELPEDVKLNPTTSTYVARIIREKFALQVDHARRAIRSSFAGKPVENPLPFASLSEEQKRNLTFLLVARAVAEGGFELYTSLNNHYASYVKDPQNTRLISRGSAIGILGPMGEATFIRRGVLPPPTAPNP